MSPVYEGMLKEEMDAAAQRHPDVPYSPVLIDATYAGLITGAADGPLVIPALNRDGDCLSDFVLPMFGSIAGAESVLLALDADYEPRAVMAEAPHGTAPALEGKDIANPMAMILAGAALLHYAAVLGSEAAETASRAIYEAVLEAVAAGVRTPDLGGHASTQRVHRRGDRAGADEDRGLVVAVGASGLTADQAWGGDASHRRPRALCPTGSPAASRAGSCRCFTRRPTYQRRCRNSVVTPASTIATRFTTSWSAAPPASPHSPSAPATPTLAAAGIVVTEISTPTRAPDFALVSASTPAMPAT